MTQIFALGLPPTATYGSLEHTRNGERHIELRPGQALLVGRSRGAARRKIDQDPALRALLEQHGGTDSALDRMIALLPDRDGPQVNDWPRVSLVLYIDYGEPWISSFATDRKTVELLPFGSAASRAVPAFPASQPLGSATTVWLHAYSPLESVRHARLAIVDGLQYQRERAAAKGDRQRDETELPVSAHSGTNTTHVKTQKLTSGQARALLLRASDLLTFPADERHLEFHSLTGGKGTRKKRNDRAMGRLRTVAIRLAQVLRETPRATKSGFREALQSSDIERLLGRDFTDPHRLVDAMLGVDDEKRESDGGIFPIPGNDDAWQRAESCTRGLQELCRRLEDDHAASTRGADQAARTA